MLASEGKPHLDKDFLGWLVKLVLRHAQTRKSIKAAQATITPNVRFRPKADIASSLLKEPRVNLFPRLSDAGAPVTRVA